MKIRIKLLSDTCIGGGTGLGSLIDTDVEHDELGFPYIPARRLKGLLRESAVEAMEDYSGAISQKTIDELFGREGDMNGLMKIRNAYLKNYSALSEEVKAINEDASDSFHLDPDSVLNHYSIVRHQTAIDKDGIAKDDSLRAIRVVRKGNVFESECEIPSAYEEELSLICGGVRHMGINRTRGFGAVEVTLVPDNTPASGSKVWVDTSSLEEEQSYELRCVFRSDTDILANNERGDESIAYIKGAQIFGFVAAQYAAGHPDDNRTFNHLFLSGESGLHFSNAYVSDPSGIETMMSPFSLYKYKDQDLYWSALTDEQNDMQKSMLRDRTMTETVSPALTEKDLYPVAYSINYHHQRPKDRKYGHVLEDTENGGAFYQYRALKKGQIFVSSITGKGWALKEVLGILNGRDSITVGKAKNSQYGLLRILNITEEEPRPVSGTRFALVLRSPAVIIPRNFQIQNQQLLEELLDQVNPSLKVEKAYLQFATVGGFNSKWKLPQEQHIAMKAGSVILCASDTPIQFSSRRVYVGENTAAGYGEVLIFNESQFTEKPAAPAVSENPEPIQVRASRKLVKSVLEDRYRFVLSGKAIQEAEDLKNRTNTTQVGRILRATDKLDIRSLLGEESGIGCISDPENRKSAARLLRYVSEGGAFKQDLDEWRKTNASWFQGSLNEDALKMYYVRELLTDIKNLKRGEE